jgi:multiple sugar transport system substrate-binding protein
MQWKSASSYFLFCTLLLAGCRPTPPALDTPVLPHQGVELRIACPSEHVARRLRGPAQSWALRQGAKLRVTTYDPAAQAGPESAGPADVWVLAPAQLPGWAAADKLAAIPSTYTTRESPYSWTDLLPPYREQLILWGGTAYGLAILGESPLCCYRADWLENPAFRDAFQHKFGHAFDAPATWEQFEWIAEYFRDHPVSGDKGGGKSTPSLPPLPRDDADLDRLFYTVAAGYARRAVPSDEARRADFQDDVFSFHYDLKTGRPRIAEPGFVYALRLLQRLQKCRPAGSADHPDEAFREGRAVLCLTDAPRVKAFQQVPGLHDRFGVSRIPGAECYFDFARGQKQPTPKGNRVPYLGGGSWLAVVPRSSAHGDAAFDLLADLSGPKTSTQIFLAETDRGGPIRSEQLYRERWDSFDLNDKQTLNLREALQDALLHRGLRNPALCLRTPRQAAHRAALVKEVRAALQSDADAAKALHNVAQAWSQLDREHGLDAHKADYRRSLGLLAE